MLRDKTLKCFLKGNLKRNVLTSNLIASKGFDFQPNCIKRIDQLLEVSKKLLNYFAIYTPTQDNMSRAISEIKVLQLQL